MTLSPLSALYGKALEIRARRFASGQTTSHRIAQPVISVGNLTLGGSGKTPFVEFLARRLRFEGRRPAILSRGYGRQSRGMVVVSRGEGPLVGPEEGGDEPVALARRLPGVAVVVARRRIEAAVAAEGLGADLMLLDDGYQHLALRRDADLLLLDAEDPFGGETFPPRGRLREPLSALGRADAFIFTRMERSAPPRTALQTLARWNPEAPVFTACIRPTGFWDEKGDSLGTDHPPGGRFVAVCGVARPERFAATLAGLSLSPEEILIYSDHHRYGRRDLARIHRSAERSGSSWILTTEKDAVKLSGRLALPIVTIRLEVEVLEPGFFPFLLPRISPSPVHSDRS